MAEEIIYDEHGDVVEATSDGLLMFSFDVKEFNKEIKSSFPTDIIDVNYTLKQKLYELSDVTEDDDGAIPSDIILSKTIPLEDVFMNITDIGARNIGLHHTQRCRIKMMNGWKSNVDEFKKEIMKGDDCSEYLRQQLGYVMIEVRNDSWIYMVFGLSSIDQIDVLDSGVGYIANDNTIVKKEITSFLSKNAFILNKVDDITDLFFSILKTWYATQVCLLHPVIKECFKSETYALVQRQGTTNSSKSRNSKKKPPKIKYVKRRVINDEEFDRLFDDATKGNNYTRTALIWYVTGHWRTYKNGKRIFIEGFWKGALRDIKKAEPRERELVLSNAEDGD